MGFYHFSIVITGNFCIVRLLRPRYHKQQVMKFLKKTRIVLTVLFMCLPFAVYASDDTQPTNNNFDWEPVMNAIIQVESGGNAKAVSGNSCGAMQITPICVAQCNIILKARKSKKRYSLKDRFNIAKSKEMFILMQSFYNLENNIEKAIRSWNGGMRYSIKGTQRYYDKVMSYLKK